MKSHFLLLFLAICLYFFFSCRSDDRDCNSSDSFFAYTGTDQNLKNILLQLVGSNDSEPFVPEFASKYGVPLWNDSYHFPFQDRSIYAIPVKRGNIGSIWFFDMDIDHTDYFVFSRSRVEDIPELTWMFDYFNVKLSLYSPSFPDGDVEFVERVVPVSHATSSTRNSYVIEILHCNDIYTGTAGNLEYQETYCWTTYENVFYYNYNDGSGGGIEGSLQVGMDVGSGDGDGSIDRQALSSYPSASSIIQTNKNLDRYALERLDDALDDLPCSGDAIYSHLKANGIKFSSVEINSKLSGEAGYTPGKGTLSFRSSEFIDTGALYHEIFHLFQESQGSYKGAQYIGLMEFERTLFDDIAFWIDNSVKGEIPDSAYDKKKSPFVDNDVPIWEDTGYRKWLKKITKKGSKCPSSISANDLNTWMKCFDTYSRAYGGKYDFSLHYEYKALNKAFELIKTNCNK